MFSWRIFGAPRPSRPYVASPSGAVGTPTNINVLRESMARQRSAVQATVTAYPNSAEGVAASVWLGG